VRITFLPVLAQPVSTITAEITIAVFIVLPSALTVCSVCSRTAAVNLLDASVHGLDNIVLQLVADGAIGILLHTS